MQTPPCHASVRTFFDPRIELGLRPDQRGGCAHHCLPKTGKLTEGKPRFDRAVPATGCVEDDVLRLAASLDKGSEHPLANAIVSAARERELSLDKAEGFEPSTGIDVRGSVVGKKLAPGNTALMTQSGMSVESPKAQAESLRSEGASLRVLRATGDGLTTAEAVAAELGIDEVHGKVKPADKPALVDKLQREGRIVAMADDGINHAPALAKADVGGAIGAGTDAAMNSAQVTLMNGDLRGIARRG